MIKNLNVLTFSNCGQVLHDRLPNRGFPTGIEWQEKLIALHEDGAFSICYESEDVYIDFERGMVVLGIQREAGQDISFFYLDKPVHLYRGTGYVLLPYHANATVRVAHKVNSRVRQEAEFKNARDLKISPRVELRDIYTLFYQEKEKNFFFKGEQHDMFELTYVDKGAFHSIVNGTDFFLEQGELMFYGPKQWHMQYADANSSASFITVTFDMNYNNAGLLLYRKFKVGSNVANILKKLISETENDDNLSDDMILCYLKECILHILRIALGERENIKLETSIADNNGNQIISRALKFIAGHNRDKLTVAAVAHEVSVSTPYLATLFRKYLNTSPSKYLSKIKLEESKRLIREGTLNFTQIASELQFATIHHFSRKFKEQFGITPTEYAKAIR